MRELGYVEGRDFVMEYRFVDGKYERFPACVVLTAALPPHSITSSASESRLSEIVTPSTFAVFKLITSSNLTTC